MTDRKVLMEQIQDHLKQSLQLQDSQVKVNVIRMSTGGLKIIIITTLFLDITITFFEKETFANISDTISACETNILDDNCRTTYLNE